MGKLSKFRDEEVKLDLRLIPFKDTFVQEGDEFVTRNMSLSRLRGNKDSILRLAEVIEQQDSDFRTLLDRYESLSDTEFFKFFSRLYIIKLAELTKVYQKSLFNNPVERTIKTNNIKSVEKRYNVNGSTKVMRCWYMTCANIITDASFPIEDRVYTIKEISKMTKENKIALGDFYPYGYMLNNQQVTYLRQMQGRYTFKQHWLHELFLHRYEGRRSDADIDVMYAFSPAVFAGIRQDVSREEMERDYASFSRKLDRVKQEIIDCLIGSGYMSEDEACGLFAEKEMRE